ncbi:PRC-barrel domain-containing protein [Pararoseomonas sp. SCSIO 73927]|uniref:PRC-barrel domain-containing protein n=1 Tax=Pararoseomonas sp. SCSIO 73927 TaxID=3114537 RepID=UPI0030D52EBE
MRALPIAAVLAGLLAAPALAAPALAQPALAQPALAQPAPAQPAPTQPAGSAAGMTEIPAGHIRAENLIDRDVYATDNVEIGEVEDLIIDPQGRVTMVVIEVENRLGMTQKYVSVPMQRLRAVPGERRVTIDMPSAEIRSLPGVNYR